MLKVGSRAELDALAGKKPERAPAPAPKALPAPAPAPAMSPQVEQALMVLSKHVQDVATMAAQASADVAALAARPEMVMEAEIQRDTLGRMEKVVITRKKQASQ
jgi:hypothetical protein